MEEARLAGKAVPRLQLAGASERETDLQAPDTPTSAGEETVSSDLENRVDVAWVHLRIEQ